MVLKSENLDQLDGETSKTHLIVNTSHLNSEDFNTYLALSEEIERRKAERLSKMANSCIKVIKTNEETFEANNLNSIDGDMFLTALEHQTSYAPQVTDLDESLENAMKYFDEDVNVRSTAESTPTKEKKSNVGKVAAAVDKILCKTLENTPSPIIQETKYQTEIRANIRELCKKYESFEQPSMGLSSTPKSPKEKSPKNSKKSKVRQMAQLFNSKISSIIRKDTEVGQYEKLQNEFSPEPNPILKPKIHKNEKVPSVKPRTKLPTFKTSLPSPVPSPRSKRKQIIKVNYNPTTCWVAEDVFSQLSVKDKALLYNKFITDMSKKNPKFSKHAQIIEEKVKKQFARGEVIAEKQASVKFLKEELEAKCNFPKQTVSPMALERIKKLHNSSNSYNTPVKSKESEDIVHIWNVTTPDFDEEETEQNELHISTLTVVLKPSPIGGKNSKRFSFRRKNDNHNLTSLQPCSKRTNIAMQSSLPIEAYAPPKKIRRTRAERLTPKMFFQNQCLEKLFYSWLKDKNGVSFNITPVTDIEHTIDIAIDHEFEQDTLEETHKSAVDRLLEEAIAKLENVEQESLCKEAKNIEEKEIDTFDKINNNKEIENNDDENLKINLNPSTPLRASRKLKKAPAPPIPAPRHSLASGSSATSSAKHSENEESESGLSTIPKITTDDSQPEHPEKERETSEEQSQGNDMSKPIKPPRKKKTRRNLTWKKENSIIETNPITTTDSDSDYKSLEATKKISPPLKSNQKNKASNYVKRLLFKAKPSSLPIATKTQNNPNPQENSFIGLDKTLMKTLNSPRKIKSAYTLTVMSSPSPHTETEYCYESEGATKRKSIKETSHSWPSLIDVLDKISIDPQLENKSASTELSPKTKLAQPHLNEPRHLLDSFIDQGFETGSNEIESPIRKTHQLRKNSINEEKTSFSHSRRLSNDFQENLSESNPSGCSTPVKGHVQQNFTNSSDVNQNRLSPITTPIKSSSSRRKSFYENESRRNSLAMQVIKEDHPLDTASSPFSPSSNFSITENAFFANAPTMDMSSNIVDFNTTKDTSTLWITAGDFTITTEIFYNSRERIRCLYNIFSQKTCEARQIHFGIDKNKFCYQNLTVNDEEVAQRLPKPRDTSHYWFQTSDLVIPFSGKHVPEHRVKRLFKFISECLADNDQIRIGVDAFEFCVFELNEDNEAEFVSNQPKFSIESSYSMLIGLQSGNSNGLEGRSKFAWPSSMSSSTHSNNVRTSDLGQSGCESEEFENDLGRLSFSPFGTDDLNMRRTSESGMSAELFSLDFENEPLDQLFKDTLTINEKPNDIESNINNNNSTTNSISNSNSNSTSTSTLNSSKMEALLERTQASVNNALQHLKEIIPEVQNEYEYVINYKKDTINHSNSMSLDEMLFTLKNQQTKLKIVLDTLRNYSKYTNGAKKFLEQIQKSPDYELKLQQIVKSIEEIGHDNGFKYCSKEQLESFMYFLSHYADLILSPFSDHMNKILDTLLDRRSIEV